MKLQRANFEEKIIFMLNDKFTFADHNIFQDILGDIKDENVDIVILNFEKLEFIDSAGLGMLLVAREEALKNKTDLIFKRPKEQVKKMFELSNFHNLFTVEEN